MNSVAFSGGNYIAAPPTNATATPHIYNVTLQNVRLTNVDGGYQGISTLKEAPIMGLHLRNISFSMTKSHKPAWTCVADCTGPGRGQGCVNGLFATGTVENVNPPLPRQCQFTAQPPTPTKSCSIGKVLGCFNDSAAPILPQSASGDHDHVTQGNCAALCAASRMPIAGIDQGNHCRCGDNSSIAAAAAHQLPASACQDREWPCTGVCCGPNAKPDCRLGACTGKAAEHCGGVGALLAYSYSCASAEVDAP